MKPKNNSSLVKHLQQDGVLHSKRLIKALLTVDRQDFVPQDLAARAYLDGPLPLGFGATISQPTTVAFMLELLQPQPGEQVLDIGTGSGWTTALLAWLVGPKGQVTGLEIVPELVTFGSDNLAKYNLPPAHIQLVSEGNLGLPGQTFDKILVSARAQSLPKELVKQLKAGGRLVLPIKESIYAMDKISADNIQQQEFPGFEFVPLR